MITQILGPFHIATLSYGEEKCAILCKCKTAAEVMTCPALLFHGKNFSNIDESVTIKPSPGYRCAVTSLDPSRV